VATAGVGETRAPANARWGGIVEALRSEDRVATGKDAVRAALRQGDGRLLHVRVPLEERVLPALRLMQLAQKGVTLELVISPR
jgi:hypothetical protein